MDSNDITHVWIVNRTGEADPLYVFVDHAQAEEYAERYTDAVIAEEVVMDRAAGAQFLTDTHEPDDEEAGHPRQEGGLLTLVDVRNAVATIVDYSYHAEERDYFEQPPDDREGHVFEHLRRLRAFLTGDAITRGDAPEQDDHISRTEDARNATNGVSQVLAQASDDATALDAIAHILRDPDWGVGILEDVAAIVHDTGRSLDNPTGEATWMRH